MLSSETGAARAGSFAGENVSFVNVPAPLCQSDSSLFFRL